MPRELEENAVIVDTSLWIEYFRRDSDLSRAVGRLVEEDRAVITGPVLYEVLQGARSQREAGLMLTSLQGLDYIETTADLWMKAGELSASLRKKGTTLPMSDLVIATAAIENGLSVYTLDKHFKQMPGLKLYSQD